MEKYFFLPSPTFNFLWYKVAQSQERTWNKIHINIWKRAPNVFDVVPFMQIMYSERNPNRKYDSFFLALAFFFFFLVDNNELFTLPLQSPWAIQKWSYYSLGAAYLGRTFCCLFIDFFFCYCWKYNLYLTHILYLFLPDFRIIKPRHYIIALKYMLSPRIFKCGDMSTSSKYHDV